ncbi:hypothetical protein V2H45_22040 [Tumidithrix elongata RA019]|uniref:Uncharacterized protein n=1 Tax=Tumidithrix elongata BACA0141 TaxID=2716417 RepID=A0AAW9Q8X0_9CYAN|nr:hypothetical protein [Tumidithrix elongata RA019]
MKTRQKLLPIAIAIFSVLIGGTGIFLWLLHRPPTVECSSDTTSNPKVYKIRAVKIVAQPWLGRHNVYGIFLVPEHYKNNPDYAVFMAVRGSNSYFTSFDTDGGNNYLQRSYLDGVMAERGYYVSRNFFPTHEALEFMIKGQFGDLQQPCNWTMLFIER